MKFIKCFEYLMCFYKLINVFFKFEITAIIQVLNTFTHTVCLHISYLSFLRKSQIDIIF